MAGVFFFLRRAHVFFLVALALAMPAVAQESSDAPAATPDATADASPSTPTAEEVPWYKDWRKSEEPKWALSLFFGEGMEAPFSESLFRIFDAGNDSQRIAGISVSRRLGGFTDHLTFELETMYAYHYGEEQYNEFGLAAYARWMTFPWNEWLPTSIAVGAGPSYTDTTPELEKSIHMKDDVRLLNQFNFEITAAAAQLPDWNLLLRLQHRSGMGGLISGVSQGSNFWSIGVLTRF